MTTATYRNEILSDFRGNLLIEALPEPREPAQAIKDLMVLPDYSGADRQLSVANRRILTQNIARIHHPLPRELEVEGAIDRCLRWGYVDRDPLLPGYAAQLSAGYKASLHGNGIQNKREYHPHTYGFSILGISGIGKSTTVETILSHYPQVIRHSNYQGIPLSLTQVTWAKLDCPADGSLKGLCLSFFDQLDRLLGTDYCDQYRKRTTLDVLMLKMAQLATAYNVGLIVLDELQNLCSAAKDVPAKVLNYLVTLVNSIGVPVVLTIFPTLRVLFIFTEIRTKLLFVKNFVLFMTIVPSQPPSCDVSKHQKRWLRFTAIFRWGMLRHVVCPHFYLPLTKRASIASVSIRRCRFPGMPFFANPPKDSITPGTDIPRGKTVVFFIIPFGCYFGHNGKKIVLAFFRFPAAAYRTAVGPS